MLILKKISLATIIILSLLVYPTVVEEAAPLKVTAPTLPTLPPIFKKIGACESHNRQFNKDGTVYHGEINHNDIGFYQINTTYWLKESKQLGYDIYTLDGNTKMALHIYQHYGTQPWNWSRSCWSK